MPDALPVSPDVIPEDHPDAEQLQPAAPPVALPPIFQPQPVTQNSVTSPNVTAAPDVIPEDAPLAAKLSSASPDNAPPPVIEEGSPAAAGLKTHAEFLSELSPDQIATQYRADKASGQATDAKDYEDAYADKVRSGGVLKSLFTGAGGTLTRAAVGMAGGPIGAVTGSLQSDTPEGKTALGHLLDIGTSMIVGGMAHAKAIVNLNSDKIDVFHGRKMTDAEYAQNASELAAGQESAFINGVGLLRQGAVNIWNTFAHTTNSEALGDKQALRDQFHTEVDLQNAKDRVAHGGSAFERPGAFGILSDSHYVDPGTVEQISQSPLADPSAFLPGLAAAKGAEIAGVAAKAQTVVEAAEVADRASLAARSAAKTAEIVSATLKKGGAVFDNTPKILKAAVAAGVTHAAGGDAALTSVMAFLGGAEGKIGMIEKGLDAATGALDSAATSLRTPVPAGPMGKFAASAASAMTDEAKTTATSLAWNIPFALGAQSQQQAIDTIETGLVAHGLVRSGQVLPKAVNSLSPITQMWHEAPRPAGERAPVKDYGIDPLLDGMHRDVVATANNVGNNLIEASRNLLKRSGSNGELYLGRPEDITRNLQDMSSRGARFFDSETGHEIPMTPETADFWAKQAGVSFSVEMPPETPAAGQPAQPPVRRSVAIVPFSEGAPALSLGHELWHVLENTVVSPEERAHFEAEATRIYGGAGSANFENARQYYAKLLGITDPSTISDSRVASEMLAETMSGRLNAIPVGAFGPGGEMTFKNTAYRRFVRDTASLMEKTLRKLGADVPETVVPVVFHDSEGRPYTTLQPGGKGVRSGLGWQLSSELGALVDNFLESKRLDTGVAEAQGHPDPFTEVQGAPTAENPIQNVREVAPEPAFKKGDPIDSIKNSDGKETATDAIVTKVHADPKGDHHYDIEFTDPADGKRKTGTVPEKLLQSPVHPDAGPIGEPTKAQRGIESVAKPNKPQIAPNKPSNSPRENARQVPEPERKHFLAERASPDVVAHNNAVIGEEVGKAASEQRLFHTDYYSAGEGSASDTGPVREARRNLVKASEAKGLGNLSKTYDKLVHIYKYNPTPKNGRPFVTAFVFDNFIANLKLVDGWLRSKGLSNDPAIVRMKSPGFVDAVQNYWRNQANGYRGDGKRLVRPADLKPETIPAENANYKPVPVSKHDVEIINLAMGIELPKTSSVATRFAAKMAKENGHAPTLNDAGVEITNPFTADLIAKGFDPNILHSTVQQLSVDKLTSKLTPSEYKGTSRAVLATTRAGFMPKPEGLAEAPEAKRLFLPTRSKLGDTPDVRTDDTTFAVKPLAPKKFETGFRRSIAHPEDSGVFMPRENGNQLTRDTADEYLKSTGSTQEQHDRLAPIDENFAKRIADFYEEAKDSPDSPAVKGAYSALAAETLDQYAYMKRAGISIEPYTGKGEPYKNSAEMRADVRDNKHLYFFKTEHGFGNLDPAAENAMLQPSGVKVGGYELPVNDVFRAVHDYFGHTGEGYEFGPRGELNAYLAHSKMYSDEAKPALAAETLAQNSWVNFGKHLRREDGSLPQPGDADHVPLAKRPFAEQKNLAVPQHFIDEAAKFMPAAIKNKETGEIAEGETHYHATIAAAKAGWFGKDLKENPHDFPDNVRGKEWDRVINSFEDGFTDPKTKEFLSRTEAYDRAKERGYRVPGDKKYLNAEDANFMPKTAAQHAGEHLEHAVGDDMNLIHFGGTGQRSVDPKEFGKSGLTPRSELSGAPRSYFYEQGKYNTHDPVAQRGDVYGAKVSGSKIYDGDKDPLGYGDEINREKADNMLKDEGYVGIARTAGTGKKAYRQVEMFKPTRVSPIDEPSTPFMPKERSDEISDSIKKAFRSNPVADVLMNKSIAQSGPFDGGCLIVAKALQHSLGEGELVRIVSDANGGQTEHYGLETSHGIVDAAGVHASPEKWIADFEKSKGTDNRKNTFARGFDENSDVPDDPRAVKELAKELTKRLPVGPQFMPRSSPAQEKALKDSKVRGPDGKLLPVFHGTYSDFKHFGKGDLGYHFGTQEAAAARIGDALKTNEVSAEDAYSAFGEMRANLPPGARGAIEGIADGARTLPVFLDLKNPLRMPDVGQWNDPQDVLLNLPNSVSKKLSATAKDAVEKYVAWRDGYSGPTKKYATAKEMAAKPALIAIREGLKSLGYDGVVYKNDFEGIRSEPPGETNVNLSVRREGGAWNAYGTDGGRLGTGSTATEARAAALKFVQANHPRVSVSGDSYIAFDNKQIVPAYSADAKARFMPRSKELQTELEKKGYSIDVDKSARGDVGVIRVNKGDEEIGRMVFDQNGKTATITEAHVDLKHRGKGIGELLYRIAGNWAADQKVKILAGEVYGKAALRLREKVLGKTQYLDDNLRNLTFEEAHNLLPEHMRGGEGDHVSARTEISPTGSFMPREKIAVPGNPELQDAIDEKARLRSVPDSRILTASNSDKKRGVLAEAP